MPIMSYLAYPMDGRRDELLEALRALPGCEVLPAENRDLVVLVTDTPDRAAEQALQERLQDLPSLQCLALVSGYAEPDAATEE